MTPAILFIDIQKEYDKGGLLEIKNIGKSLAQLKKLLKFARENKTEIIHVQHIGSEDGPDFRPGTKAVDFIEGFEPLKTETVVTKHYPGSFFQTDLQKHLKAKKIDTIFICGYSSFLCCDTTAREAFQNGYKVYFIDDAIGEFKIGKYSEDEAHAYACTVQAEAGFSEVVKTEETMSMLR